MNEMQTQTARVNVEGYELALDRAYDPDTHLWVLIADPHSAVIGFDPLGLEANGTLAQLAFEPVGSTVARGEPFGTLEAAKYVGPLPAPLSGTIVRHNERALADPGVVERDPFGEGWLVELEPDAAAFTEELALLHRGGEEVQAWFRDELEEFRVRGVRAE